MTAQKRVDWGTIVGVGVVMALAVLAVRRETALERARTIGAFLSEDK